MRPPDSQPNKRNSETTSERSHQSTVHQKWVLTTESLNKLLALLSFDREEAGRQYELIRRRLLRFFEWRCCTLAEDLADETINRVARRVEEGENIFNLPAYFLSVARLIFMESLRERERSSVPLEEIKEIAAEPQLENEQQENRLRCLDHCLEKLPVESRSLILMYHHKERQAKIAQRKQLAESLGIPLNALRIRAHRIRLALEQCVQECLGSLT